MNKIYNLSILLSFFGLWVTSIFSGTLEIVLGFILIFSFGILHGSNDILLINSITNGKTKHPFVRVLITYLLTVFAAVIVFYFIPLLALVLFIVFSAYHFGEQHWEYHNLLVPEKLKHIFYFVYGLFVLQLLFVLNPNGVIEVVYAITNYTLHQDIISYTFFSNVLVLGLLTIILSLKSYLNTSILLKELFYLLVFAIIFKVSTLIWGFTIYFILWHSVPSLFEQVNFIYGTFNKKNIIRYCKTALPYWLLSLIGMVVVYLLFKEEQIFYAIFFSFIAAVTFPHALVINKMFLNKKTQSN